MLTPAELDLIDRGLGKLTLDEAVGLYLNLKVQYVNHAKNEAVAAFNEGVQATQAPAETAAALAAQPSETAVHEGAAEGPKLEEQAG